MAAASGRTGPRRARVCSRFSAGASGPASCSRCCSPRRDARSRRTSTCIGRPARRRRTGRGAAARQGVGRARDDAERRRRTHGRAVAQDGRRRLPAQRRLRLQRRPHGELRSRRRRASARRTGARLPRGDRRRRRRPHRRRAVDGIERLSRGAERARGVRARDRDGARRDRADARDRARRARAHLRGEGDGPRLRVSRSRRR